MLSHRCARAAGNPLKGCPVGGWTASVPGALVDPNRVGAAAACCWHVLPPRQCPRRVGGRERAGGRAAPPKVFLQPLQPPCACLFFRRERPPLFSPRQPGGSAAAWLRAGCSSRAGQCSCAAVSCSRREGSIAATPPQPPTVLAVLPRQPLSATMRLRGAGRRLARGAGWLELRTVTEPLLQPSAVPFGRSCSTLTHAPVAVETGQPPPHPKARAPRRVGPHHAPPLCRTHSRPACDAAQLPHARSLARQRACGASGSSFGTAGCSFGGDYYRRPHLVVANSRHLRPRVLTRARPPPSPPRSLASATHLPDCAVQSIVA